MGNIVTCRSCGRDLYTTVIPSFCPICRVPLPKPLTSEILAEIAVAYESLLDIVWRCEREWNEENRWKLRLR